MIVYNTTFHVEDEILAESINYLKSEYIPFAVRSGLLIQPVLLRVLQDAEAGTGLCVQFRVQDQDTLHNWVRQDGMELQRKLAERFGNKMPGFSTLLEEINL
jgi:hypothetical protein